MNCKVIRQKCLPYAHTNTAQMLTVTVVYNAVYTLQCMFSRAR